MNPSLPPTGPRVETEAVRRSDEGSSLVVVLAVSRRGMVRVAAACVLCLLSLFVVRTYVQTYDPVLGWTKMILFGAQFEDQVLPRLRRLAHYTETSEGSRWGYDGQFYAQMALDPSLRDPAFDRALDMPAYRARRIGLPAAVYLFGGGKPRRVLQVYALSNLFSWFVLLGTMCSLLRPLGSRSLLCLSAGTLCLGAIASMERSLIDLPATAVLFAGLAAAGTWGGPVLLAAAVLTRETSLLAAGGYWDGRLPWRGGAWKSLFVLLAAAVVPLGLWLFYVNGRFGHDNTAGDGNFAWPLQSMYERLVEGLRRCSGIGFHNIFHKWWRGHWLYEEYEMMELLALAAMFVQGFFLVLRRDWRSPVWRVGAGYVALGLVLGPAVWDNVGAAARVLLPMTICFYLRLARERGGWWFWPFFVLGSLSTPWAIHDFWLGI